MITVIFQILIHRNIANVLRVKFIHDKHLFKYDTPFEKKDILGK